MSIGGQDHFFTIYFTGFVCFVLYLDKKSGERLQDHWSSGFYVHAHARSKLFHLIKILLSQALNNLLVLTICHKLATYEIANFIDEGW